MNEIEKRNNEILQETKERAKKYDELRDMLIASAKKRYGETFFSDPSVPKNFYQTLGNEYFDERRDQTTPMPGFDFHSLIKMKKRPIRQFRTTNKGKTILCSYLVGKDANGKPILFALSVVRDNKNKQAFNIKLDFCPQGKEWINLVRIDGAGPAHPNYIDGHKVLDSVEYSDTPHIHFNSEMAQVLFHDNLTYTSAQDLSKFADKNASYKDGEFYEKLMRYFLEFTNIDAKVNENSFKNTYEDLFDYDSLYYIENDPEYSGGGHEI